MIGRGRRLRVGDGDAPRGAARGRGRARVAAAANAAAVPLVLGGFAGVLRAGELLVLSAVLAGKLGCRRNEGSKLGGGKDGGRCILLAVGSPS